MQYYECISVLHKTSYTGSAFLTYCRLTCLLSFTWFLYGIHCVKREMDLSGENTFLACSLTDIFLFAGL